MNQRAIKFQIGKQGITAGIIDSLNLSLKNHKQVRISALKSSGRNKESIGEMAEEIVRKLPKENIYQYRIIGFTIVLRRLSKKAAKRVKVNISKL